MLRVYNCLIQQHLLWLSSTAALICVFSCAATFFLYSKVPVYPVRRRWIWLAMTGLVSGSGTWATHFVAMLSFQTGRPISYGAVATIASLGVAIVSATLGFAIGARTGAIGRAGWNSITGGVIIGLGIAMMHYLGMSAVRASGLLQWDHAYMAASVLIGVAFAAAGLRIAPPGANLRVQALGAILLGFAILGLHFTGMAAITIVPDTSLPVAASVMTPEAMTIATIIVTGLIMLTVVGGAAYENAGHDNNLRRLRQALDAMPAGLAFYDADDRLIAWNMAYEEVGRAARTALQPGLSFSELTQSLVNLSAIPEAVGHEQAWLSSRLDTHRRGTYAVDQRAPDGRWLRVTDHATPDGGVLTVVNDITDLKHAEEAMAEARDHERALSFELRTLAARKAAIFDSVNDAILLIHPTSGSLAEINESAVAMFGYSAEELIGLSIADLSSGFAPYDRTGCLEILAQSGRGSPQVLEWHMKRKDGTLFWVEMSIRSTSLDGSTIALAVLRDITERKETAARLARIERYDQLTGLANRAVFIQALDREIARTKRGEAFALLYLDLDHFKDINDTLGHPIGDLLLKSVAERLKSCVRVTDTVARFGGDEFALLLSGFRASPGTFPRAAGSPGMIDPLAASVATVARGVADKILSALAEPFNLQGNEIRCGASIGIAVSGPDQPDAENMISQAEMALYRAKSDGRGASRFFTDAMDAEVRTRVTLGMELREAVTKEQFYLLFQPQVDIGSQRPIGLEALVRWRHPARGMVSPTDFIPLAEINGLIVPIGNYVLHEACRQIRLWLDAGLTPPTISVNVSSSQFKVPMELEANLAACLSEFGVPARMIELELTESVLMTASREHNDALVRLRQAGHRLAIDDFGTGYSSLDYLRRYPVDQIKIAQTFVADIGETPSAGVVVRAALGLARELGIDVVVEGVETEAQLEMLRTWGVKVVQGYYFARPLTAEAATALLQRGIIVRADDERSGRSTPPSAESPSTPGKG